MILLTITVEIGGIIDHHRWQWWNYWLPLKLVELLTITVKIGGIIDYHRWNWWNYWLPPFPFNLFSCNSFARIRTAIRMFVKTLYVCLYYIYFRIQQKYNNIVKSHFLTLPRSENEAGVDGKLCGIDAWEASDEVLDSFTSTEFKLLKSKRKLFWSTWYNCRLILD